MTSPPPALPRSEASRPLLPLEGFPPALRKFLDPAAPAAAAEVVVRGLVPMPAPTRVCALYQVAHAVEALASAARAALAALPDEALAEALAAPLPSPALDWLAEALAEALAEGAAPRPAPALALLAHAALPPRAALRLIAAAPPELLERLAENQALLQARPHLLHALCLAPRTPLAARERTLEWARYAGVDVEVVERVRAQQAAAESRRAPAPPAAPAPAAPAPAPPAPAPTSVGGGGQGAVELSELGAPVVPALSRAPLSLAALPPALARFLDPSAPEGAARALLSGAVPMPGPLRVATLYELSLRPAHAPAALEAARGLPEELALQACGPDAPAGLLDWAAEVWADSARVTERVARHAGAHDLTLARLALHGPEALAEELALNQRRWLASPLLLQALYFNPRLRASTADRLVELAAREGVDLSWLPEAEALVASLTGGAPAGGAPAGGAPARGAPAEADALFSAALEEGRARPLEEALAAADAPEGASPAGEERPQRRGLALIQSLNVAQKIRLALLGSQSDRAVLVKDSNKVVARAAIRSPSVSVSEALMYARNGALSAATIEYIATHKKWMQSYRLRAQIVLNPKTPTHIALQALLTLRSPELRAVAQSHGVPSAVSDRARALIKARQG